jgi:nucleoid-associated protein YgaU
MGVVPSTSFPTDSRYYGSSTLQYTAPNGNTYTYLQRRFVPPPSDFSTFAQHTVIQGERLDQISAKYLGDPLLYWRVCDANGAIQPEELEAPGTTLNITLPQGIPGVNGA